MIIKHVLADGSVVHDITGHVVQITDAEKVYTILNGLRSTANKRRTKERQK